MSRLDRAIPQRLPIHHDRLARQDHSNETYFHQLNLSTNHETEID
jgi:hypothetical protein